jgi:hypothetical protein
MKKECCKKPENLESSQAQPDMRVDRCRVCGCRHFRFKADPGVIGLRLSQRPAIDSTRILAGSDLTPSAPI